NNIDVVGAGWGAYVLSKPDFTRKLADELDGMIRSGHVRPIVGNRFPLEQAGEAMRLIEERGALGKVVLDVAPAAEVRLAALALTRPAPLGSVTTGLAPHPTGVPMSRSGRLALACLVL